MSSEGKLKREIRAILHKSEITSYEVGYMEAIDDVGLLKTRADFVLKVFKVMAEIAKLVEE